jgi:hypothetical protein
MSEMWLIRGMMRLVGLQIQVPEFLIIHARKWYFQDEVSMNGI